MHVLVSREQLARGIQAVTRAVSIRGPLPILSHIKLVADPDAPVTDPHGGTSKGALILTATDLEIGLEARVMADVRVPGAIALAAKTLGDIVTKLPAAEVEIKKPDGSNEITLRCQRAKFTLRGLSAQEFPELPMPSEDATPVALETAELSRSIRQTLYAAAGEDKAVISGILTELAEGKLELAATDGFRLAWRQATSQGADAKMSLVVPRRTMDELSRQLTASGAGQVQIRSAQNQVVFQMPDRYMTSRLVDGTYPNYRQIIPQAFEREAKLDRASFLAAVERVSIMALDREAHTIKLEFKSGELLLMAQSSEVGDSDEVLPIEFSGEPITISFNATFVIDALKNVDAETVRFSMNAPLLPALLRPEHSDDQICLLMPVNRG
ncbi:MAG: DNA polymerase III subunit beta [Candidatus Sericytochromatia bacterium]|nr:DNA polymerase III subunit beta [Candidatus Sericytochromatia bacterium]